MSIPFTLQHMRAVNHGLVLNNSRGVFGRRASQTIAYDRLGDSISKEALMCEARIFGNRRNSGGQAEQSLSELAVAVSMLEAMEELKMIKNPEALRRLRQEAHVLCRKGTDQQIIQRALARIESLIGSSRIWPPPTYLEFTYSYLKSVAEGTNLRLNYGTVRNIELLREATSRGWLTSLGYLRQVASYLNAKSLDDLKDIPTRLGMQESAFFQLKANRVGDPLLFEAAVKAANSRGLFLQMSSPSNGVDILKMSYLRGASAPIGSVENKLFSACFSSDILTDDPLQVPLLLEELRRSGYEARDVRKERSRMPDTFLLCLDSISGVSIAVCDLPDQDKVRNELLGNTEKMKKALMN